MNRYLTDNITGDFETPNDVRKAIVNTLEGRENSGHKTLRKHQINNWMPTKQTSSLELKKVDINYEDGRYMIKKDRNTLPQNFEKSFSFRGPPPRSAYQYADGIILNASKGGSIASINILYLLRKRYLSQWISEPFMLLKSLEDIKKNSGEAPGVDGVTPQDARYSLCWDMADHLKNGGKPEPDPLRMIYVSKGKGMDDLRPINIPTVKDRVFQKSAYIVFEEFYQQYFSEYSFGFRTGFNFKKPLEVVQDYMNKGYRWAVSVDLKNCFENIPQPLIEEVITEDTGDERLGEWVKCHARTYSIFDAETTENILGGLPEDHEDGQETPVREKGVPQGGPLSPMTLNIVMNRFDQWCEHNNYKFARYADDITLLTRKKGIAKQRLNTVKAFLENEMGMIVNRKKSKITNGYEDPVTFLGFDLYKGTIHPSEGNMEKIKEKILEDLGEKELSKMMEELKGWFNYFGSGGQRKAFTELEEWFTGLINEVEETL